LVEETGVLSEETTDLSQVNDKFYHTLLCRLRLYINGVRTGNYNISNIIYGSCVWNAFFFILVLNATLSNISTISWRQVLVVEKAGAPGKNHRPWASN